uniref:Transcription factor bHLH111 n=1 Tax=Aegilops tauschii TaxID=37682 RepID=N1QTN2_AEGTA
MQTSFTKTSTNHSGISMDDSSAATAAVQSHLWNQVVMGTGGEVARSMQVVHDAHNDDSENFLELLNSRTLATELFAEPPACDYLKKMEYGGGSAWPDVHQFSAANMDKHLPSASGPGYWSIAPPNPCHGDSGHHQRVGGSGPCDNAAAMGHVAKALFLDADGNVKHEMGGGGHGAILQEAASTSSTSSQDFTRPIGLGYSSMQGLISNRMYGGGAGAYDVAMDVRWGRNDGRDPRSLSGLISFGRGMGKPAPSGSPAKTSSAEYKKQGREMSSPVPEKTSTSGGCGKGSSALSTKGKKRSEEERGSEGNVKKSKHESCSPTSSSPKEKTSTSGGCGKGSSALSAKGKKRSEEERGSEGNVKKSKHESCSPTSSSPKGQVTKVKLGHKITALQQMVSPFGKTDTASVLYEAINYIKWLHEQVQLLSDPYMKSCSSKDYKPWVRSDGMEKEDAETDLKSRGLCLVPLSRTPQVYMDSNGPDYWTPPNRSCLFQ